MDWFPWYFTLYEQHTMHLDPYQDGCYRRLIDHYMKTRAPLPDNDYALARIIGDSYDNWVSKAASAIRPFFKTKKDGNLYHNRCDRELHYQDGCTKRLSESGKKGAEARERKRNKINALPSTPSATLKPPLSPCLSTGQDSTGEEEERKKESLSVDFEIFWEAYPRRAGSNPKKPAMEKYLKIVAKGEPIESILLGAKAYAESLRSEGKESTQFVAQAVTWLNQERWRDKNSTGRPTRETLGYTPLGVGG